MPIVNVLVDLSTYLHLQLLKKLEILMTTVRNSRLNYRDSEVKGKIFCSIYAVLDVSV